MLPYAIFGRRYLVKSVLVNSRCTIFYEFVGPLIGDMLQTSKLWDSRTPGQQSNTEISFTKVLSRNSRNYYSSIT